MKILILGVNGFIGNALVRRILKETSWESTAWTFTATSWNIP
jgi:nucleoside-diphosphate-sugar epimerase